jgi:RNA polymerase sigma factor (sigma-70 family)
MEVVLRHLRRLATARRDLELPDRDLLERFAAHQDEGAFTALLQRHGPMVMGVCQSVLHNVHDAEDVFQAAFLVLARKAGTIHRRDTVAGWLHRVAYHLAVKAQAHAVRRRGWEKRAATMPVVDPVLDLSLRELRRVLIEEIQQLPEEYQAPLVLCGLEEKSLAEAARLLAWTKGEVKGRLQRGRERLRARLRRRGLEIPLGLSAAAFTLNSASAQVSASLVRSTVQAAVRVAAGKAIRTGVVSAEVAALVQGASKTMLYSHAKMATVLLLALSVVATAFGVVRLPASAADQPAPQAQKAQSQGDRLPAVAPAKTEAEGTLEVRGQVLAPDGRPAAGAKVYLAKPHAPAPVQQAATDPDGRFRLAVPRSELEKSTAGKAPLQILAVAEGHGCDWASLGSANVEVTLRLVKDDVPISGRILDPEGKPVVGARLTVTGLSAAKGDDLGSYLEAVRAGDFHYTFAKTWNGPLPGRPVVLTTGADGRFKLSGAGRERLVRFHLEGPAIAVTDLEVIGRSAETVTGTEKRHVYGARFDYVGVASRPIRGVVRDKETGKPLAGAHVFQEYWVNPKYEVNQLHAITDKEGRYELLGLPKGPSYRLAVRPAAGQLYFQRHITLRDTPGLEPLPGDIDMVQGLTVRGKVVDKATGKPVAGAMVDYHALYANTNVNKLAGTWSPRSEAITNTDGSYVLTVLPGAGFLGIAAPQPEAYMTAQVTLKERKDFFKTPLAQDGTFGDNILLQAVGGNAIGPPISQDSYNAIVLLEPEEKEETLVRDVALEPPQARKGRVVGPDDKPLTGVTAIGLVRHGVESIQTLKDAEFTVQGINPKAKRPLFFYHKEKNLGIYLKDLPEEKSGPFTVKLLPCGSASGRIVDPDGQPIAGWRIEIARAHGWGGHQEVITDKDGKFRAEGLVPEQEYYVSRSRVPRILAHVVAESGKHKDMGDIKAPMDNP